MLWGGDGSPPTPHLAARCSMDCHGGTGLVTPPSPHVSGCHVGNLRTGPLRAVCLRMGVNPKGQQSGWLSGPATLPFPVPAATSKGRFLSQISETFKMQKPVLQGVFETMHARIPGCHPQTRQGLTWVRQTPCVFRPETLRSACKAFYAETLNLGPQTATTSPFTGSMGDRETGQATPQRSGGPITRHHWSSMS